ncbi:MAG: SHOCT-like domain-containing protein, partial [bacterium]
MNEDREMVLRMLKEGKISVEEADALLQALAEEAEAPQPSGEPEEARQRTGPELRVELGDLIRELTESIPKEVIHELKEIR